MYCFSFRIFTTGLPSDTTFILILVYLTCDWCIFFQIYSYWPRHSIVERIPVSFCVACAPRNKLRVAYRRYRSSGGMFRTPHNHFHFHVNPHQKQNFISPLASQSRSLFTAVQRKASEQKAAMARGLFFLFFAVHCVVFSLGVEEGGMCCNKNKIALRWGADVIFGVGVQQLLLTAVTKSCPLL